MFNTIFISSSYIKLPTDRLIDKKSITARRYPEFPCMTLTYDPMTLKI